MELEEAVEAEHQMQEQPTDIRVALLVCYFIQLYGCYCFFGLCIYVMFLCKVSFITLHGL